MGKQLLVKYNRRLSRTSKSKKESKAPWISPAGHTKPGGWKLLKIKSFNFEKRLLTVFEDLPKLVTPGVHASWEGLAWGYAMKYCKHFIICKGTHDDECKK